MMRGTLFQQILPVVMRGNFQGLRRCYACLCRSRKKDRIYFSDPETLNIIINTGTDAVRETAADGFESCTFQIVHYPAGRIYGEIIVRVPVLLEAVGKFSSRTTPDAGAGNAGELLLERAAPALETFTDSGWQLNANGGGGCMAVVFPGWECNSGTAFAYTGCRIRYYRKVGRAG